MPTIFSPCIGAIAKIAGCDTEKVFSVHFDGANGELLATQKHSGDLDSLDEGGDE
jgi:hypothetical protein